ncbi:MAG: hypothetical protein ACJ8G7_23765 [Rhizobacter sp.]
MPALARSLTFVASLGALRALGALGAFGLAAASPADGWPTPGTPAGARIQVVADEMILNGRPCRVFRFDVRASDDEVLAFYRERFRTTRAVEARVKAHRVIATREGDYFHTVQLNPDAGARRVEGTVITTALRGQPERSSAAADIEAWLPADTAVLSTMQSSDGLRGHVRALTVVAVNRHSVQANRDHVAEALRQRGFRLVDGDTPATDTPAAHSPASVSLTFASPTEEAALTISDAGLYRAVLIHRTKEAK